MTKVLNKLCWMASLILLCGLGSCKTEAVQIDPDARRAFFDLAAFVNFQDSLLSGKSMMKAVAIGRVDQAKRIEQVDWSEELAPFAQANLNKPAFLDSYAVDSVLTAEGKLELEYVALDSSLRTRKLLVLCQENCDYANVLSIIVRNSTKSVIAETEQRLQWTPDGFEVYSRQATLFVKARELHLKGSPLPD